MDDSYRRYLVEGRLAGMRYALAAPKNMPRGVLGSQVGDCLGSSLEFMDHREYQPGDDIRRIDWNAFARSDKLILKLYRAEVSPHVDIIIDGSSSMALADTAKPRALLSLSAMFAQAAANSGYSHSAWLAGSACRKIAGSSEPGDMWDGIELNYNGSPVDSFAGAPVAFRPRGIRIFLSDLLFAAEPMATLVHLEQRASVVIVVQILAAGDIDPPAAGNLRLVDSESGRTVDVFVDAAARNRYAAAMGGHQDNWNRSCRRLGAVLTSVTAEKFCSDWSLDELLARDMLRVI